MIKHILSYLGRIKEGLVLVLLMIWALLLMLVIRNHPANMINENMYDFTCLDIRKNK